MPNEAQERAELAGVDVSRTVSPEPEHSSAPAQDKKALYAEPTPTQDPVTLEAQGLEND